MGASNSTREQKDGFPALQVCKKKKKKKSFTRLETMFCVAVCPTS